MTLSRVLRIFTSLDFSNNRFEGNIPDVGQLVSLLVLNFSHNALTGSIPPSMANLVQLELLDLSGNQLRGQILPTLSNLTFLSFLNLSNNNLVGRIPDGTQLSTFSNTSFEGNKRLCGSPLTIEAANEVNWQFVFIGIGFGGGLATVVGVMMSEEIGTMRRLMGCFWQLFLRHFHSFAIISEIGGVAAEERMDSDYKEIDGLLGRKFCVFCTKLEFYKES